ARRRDLEGALRLRRQLRPEPEEIAQPALRSEEVPPEDPVVDGEIDVAGDQTGATGPVEVGQVRRVEAGQALAEGQHLSGADGHALLPQGPAKADENIEHSAGVICVFRHRSRAYR